MALLVGCGEHTTGPATSGLDVHVTTNGEDPDPDGYALSVDGRPPTPVGDNATLAFTDLPGGWHSVSLGGIAPNCAVAGRNPSRVLATANDIGQVAFQVECRHVDGVSPIPLVTYDGSGQAVHPDVARAAGLPGPSLWMGVTPYPFGNATFENPSVYQSDDPLMWSVPPGLLNPVATPRSSYYSDPDITFDAAAKELWLYFRQVASSQNIVQLTRSADGITWSAPVPLITVPSHQLVSPAVVHGAPGAAWQMWSVNSGTDGCRASATSVEHRTSQDGLAWSPPQRVNLQQSGINVWHIEVQWLPSRGEYWALYNAYPSGTSCVTPWLFLATSPDGIAWTTFPTPVLSHHQVDEFWDVVYRSTFEYDPASLTVTIWYSGAKYSGTQYIWRLAVQTRRVEDLLSQVRQPAPALLVARERSDRPLPPPEPADTLP